MLSHGMMNKIIKKYYIIHQRAISEPVLRTITKKLTLFKILHTIFPSSTGKKDSPNVV